MWQFSMMDSIEGGLLSPEPIGGYFDEDAFEDCWLYGLMSWVAPDVEYKGLGIYQIASDMISMAESKDYSSFRASLPVRFWAGRVVRFAKNFIDAECDEEYFTNAIRLGEAWAMMLAYARVAYGLSIYDKSDFDKKIADLLLRMKHLRLYDMPTEVIYDNLIKSGWSTEWTKYQSMHYIDEAALYLEKVL